MRAKQNYIARIAIISPKESFVKVHFWDVADNRATIKSSKPRKTRFERRKTNYVKIGETKIGKYTCIRVVRGSGMVLLTFWVWNIPI